MTSLHLVCSDALNTHCKCVLVESALCLKAPLSQVERSVVTSYPEQLLVQLLPLNMGHEAPTHIMPHPPPKKHRHLGHWNKVLCTLYVRHIIYSHRLALIAWFHAELIVCKDGLQCACRLTIISL